ncbi:MAG: MotA/TolQ/ExbB proton channel family protein, partial [Gammaproteobacteria bacterium]
MTPSEIAVPTLGFAHFLAHTDAVGIGLFILLLAMSVLSWAVIVGRMRRGFAQGHRNRRFLADFTRSREFGPRLQVADAHAARAPLARIAKAGFSATREPGAPLHDVLQHSLDSEVARLESGQTALASIASSAPFVGLFGTVWGIYHALLKIAATGQTSLDQVAGPIGEALIMTACGLAVAIPAGLAYNA